MENEIKVNDYVRLKDGTIAKVIKIKSQNTDIINWYCLDNDMGTMDRSIVKHSSNLKDIIELGDCVKLFMEEFVDEGKVEEDTNIFEVIAITTDKKEIGVFTKNFEIEFFPIENIREIYTQEMMESISYKVRKM